MSQLNLSLSSVATPNAAVGSMTEAWDLARALLGGTFAMRKAGKKYLPQFPKEDDEAYKKRLAAAVLFPAYGRTVATLAGKAFAKPVTISEDVPEVVAKWLENVDCAGRNLGAFASDGLQVVLGYGLGGILVDYPVVERPPGAPPITQAEEQALGLRPSWVEIKCGDLLGWRATIDKKTGTRTLLQVRFFECETEQVGAYGEKEVRQIRVIEPTRWEIHRLNDRGVWVIHKEGVNTLGVVPFVPIYGERVAYMVGRPPLLEVAHLNVAHWQSASDQQTILHVARVPILAVTGVDETTYKLTVGASTATVLPMGADLKYVEHTGAAIQAGVDDLDKLEERMRQAGAELLVIKPGQITATQTNTENAVGMCALAKIVENYEDALDEALALTLKWAKLPENGSITLHKDFGAATLAEATAQLLVGMAVAGKLSDQTLHQEMQRRGVLSSDKTWEEEKALIDAQGPAPGVDDEIKPGSDEE